LIQCNKIQPR